MRQLAFAQVLTAGCIALFSASPAWAMQWTMIDGTDQRWWVDTDTISVDQKQGITFFTQAMSETAAVAPDATSAQMGIGAVHEAVDCATGEEFTFSYHNDDNGHWTREMSNWPPAYHVSIRHIVCKQ